MRVHVEKDIYISCDGREFTVERKQVAKTGKNAGNETYVGFAHFGTLQGCCNYLLKMKLAESSAKTIGELLAEIDGIKCWIEEKITV